MRVAVVALSAPMGTPIYEHKPGDLGFGPDIELFTFPSPSLHATGETRDGLLPVDAVAELVWKHIAIVIFLDLAAGSVAALSRLRLIKNRRRIYLRFMKRADTSLDSQSNRGRDLGPDLH